MYATINDQLEGHDGDLEGSLRVYQYKNGKLWQGYYEEHIEKKYPNIGLELDLEN